MNFFEVPNTSTSWYVHKLKPDQHWCVPSMFDVNCRPFLQSPHHTWYTQEKKNLEVDEKVKRQLIFPGYLQDCKAAHHHNNHHNTHVPKFSTKEQEQFW
jgi:hypothetical protein